MRIDAHQHYWKIDRGDYDWMAAPAVAPIRRDFLPGDLAPHLKKHSIDRSIVVQAAPTIAETNFLLGLASESPSIAGVVGWLDVEGADFERALAHYSQWRAFRGIRPMLQDLADDRFLLRPRVLESLRALAASGLTLDLLVLPRHLPVVLEALPHLPGLRAVVDHCAKPDLRTGSLDAWRASLARVAEYPNVVCKLSGLVTEAHPGFDAKDLAPAVEHVLRVFGPDRLLFGSDWPVCTLAASYDRVMGVLYEILGDGLAGPFEQKLFGENAARFYGV